MFLTYVGTWMVNNFFETDAWLSQTADISYQTGVGLVSPAGPARYLL